jgi:hypothetical protein
MKKAGMMTGYLVFLAALILRGPRCHTQEFSKIYSSLPLVGEGLREDQSPGQKGVIGRVGGKHQSCVVIWE